MTTLAGARTSPRKPQRIGRSFALLDQATRERLATLLRPLPWVDGLVTAVVIATGSADDPRYAEHAPEWLHHIWSEAIDDDGISVDATAEVMAAVVSHHRYRRSRAAARKGRSRRAQGQLAVSRSHS